MTPEEWRERVGRPVEARRIACGYRSVRATAAAAGVSEGLWRQLESGRRQLARDLVVVASPGARTIAGVAKALGWPPDWLELLLDDEDPNDYGVSLDDNDDYGALTAKIESLDRELTGVKQSLADLLRQRREELAAAPPRGRHRSRNDESDVEPR